MPSPSGFVGLSISAEKQHLAEYLACRGFHVQLLDWMGVHDTPDVIVTDQALPDTLVRCEELSQIGLIGLGLDQRVDVFKVEIVFGRNLVVNQYIDQGDLFFHHLCFHHAEHIGYNLPDAGHSIPPPAI